MSSVLALLGLSLSRGRRVPRSGWSALTSKLGPVGFYKGRQVPSTGRLTRKGAFEVLEHKRPRFRLPSIGGVESSELKPYVARDPSFTASASKKAG